ncbi:hypothetical protein [Aegicerativicinus sediminis]|uniref:hypothetical protein n=1 Tax=Aegicerativicinus sediminis TaxID=2893202 RepID=UPI001E42D9AD|nr:hypothetical protein [Aegicerativicinus sediminis]
MENYFFKIGMTYTDKNNLYKDFSKYIHGLDSTLIIGKEGLKAFKNQIRDKISELEQIHSRCKPIQFDIYSSYKKDGSFHVSCSGSFTADIFKVKQNFESL